MNLSSYNIYFHLFSIVYRFCLHICRYIYIYIKIDFKLVLYKIDNMKK